MGSVLLAGLIFASGCQDKSGNWHLTARQQCYADDYCYSADSDCAVGLVIVRMTLGLDRNPNANANDALANLLLSPALCVGAKHDCIKSCNEKHPL